MAATATASTPVGTQQEVSIGAWETTLAALTRGAEAVLVIALLLELGLTFFGVWTRYLFDLPVPWTDEIASICLNVVTFVGGAVALRRGRGMSLTFFLNRMRSPWRENVAAAGQWASLLFVVAILTALPAFLQRSLLLKTPVLGLPTLSGSIWLAAGYLLLALYVIDGLRAFTRRQLVTGLLLAAAICGLAVVYRASSPGGTSGVDPIFPLEIAFALAFVAGVPIAFVLGLAALTYIVGTGTVPLAATPVAFQSGIASFVLLAIPFFMLTGVLMDMGGMAGRLVSMVAPIVGRLRGGLLVAEVVSVYIFSGISGSKIADIAAIGSVMGRPLKRAGYTPSESTAVLAASAAMSETVPPSLTIIVLASITSLSVGALFMAGIIPALLMAGCLVGGILWRGRGGRFPREAPSSLLAFLRSVPGAIPALLLPVVLVGGIVLAIGTPTEVSAFAAVYGLIIAAAAYGKLRFRDFWSALVESSSLGGMTLLILSTATLMSQMITIDQVPQRIAVLLSGAGGKVTFLVLSLAGLVLLGSLLEGLPALLVFAPLLMPIAKGLGIDQLQYAIALIVAMGIGAFAPPIGVGLYVACAIGGASVEETAKPSLFYTLVLLAGLTLIAAFPFVTVALPHLLNLG